MYLNNGALLKNGEYRIEKVLAAGGFGITYLALQVALGRKVAVKEFFMKDHCNRESGNSYVSVPSVGSKEQVERFKEKFLKEARLIASFDHSNIIRIHDVFEQNGTAYYVMEYLEGESLSVLVSRCGALDELTALRYTRQVAEALAEVHAGNLLHLDVKPANIMLNKKGDAVLIDFGISKHYDESGSQTSSAAVGISEGFAPLEQYEAGALGSFTPATDIYALGATLYFLVTGQRPPKAGDVMNDGLPVLPSDISPAVRAAITTAMQPRRKDRPQSVGEFLELLSENGKVKTESGKLKTAGERVGEAKSESDDLIDDADVEVTVMPSGSPNAKAIKEQHNANKEDSEETRVVKKEIEQPIVKNNELSEPKKNRTAWVVATVLLLVLLIGGYFVLSVNNSSNDSNAPVVAVTEDTEKPNLEFITEPTTSVVNTDSIVEARLQAYQDSIDAVNAAREAAEQQAHEEAARLEREEAERLAREQQQGISTQKKVDLGLSVCWAGWNVGATSPEGYGNYYAWGETTTKSSYTPENSTTLGKSMGSIAGNSTYDVARAQWGSSWRLPTDDDFQELIDRCTWTWTSYNGINGYKVTGPNGNCIFLPVAGYFGTRLHDCGYKGSYWSTTPVHYIEGDIDPTVAYTLFLKSDYYMIVRCSKCDGCSVRPVCDK